MADTIRVASRSPMRIRITESMEGKAPGTELKYADLNGSYSTPGSVEGVTEVDAGLFHDWIKANPDHPAVVAGLFREMGKDEDIADASNYGFEPALEAAKDAAASDGSTVTKPGPVSSTDMKATSDTPADDSPRSQTKLADTAPAVVPAPAPVPAPAAPAPVAQPVKK